MLRSALFALVAPLAASAVHPPLEVCSAPVPVPQSVTTPNATYYSDDSPPARFSHVPNTPLKIWFGQAAIDRFCGKPPCGYVFEGCTDGAVMALPDPYKTSPEDFARIVRHELSHVNGWPETHGD